MPEETKRRPEEHREKAFDLQAWLGGPGGCVPFKMLLESIDRQPGHFLLSSLLLQGKALVGTSHHLDFPEGLPDGHHEPFFISLLSEINSGTMALPGVRLKYPTHLGFDAGILPAQKHFIPDFPDWVIPEQRRYLERQFNRILSLMDDYRVYLAYLATLDHGQQSEIAAPMRGVNVVFSRQEVLNRIHDTQQAIGAHMHQLDQLLYSENKEVVWKEILSQGQGYRGDGVVKAGMAAFAGPSTIFEENSHVWQIPGERSADFVMAADLEQQEQQLEKALQRVLLTVFFGMLIAGCSTANLEPAPTPELKLTEPTESPGHSEEPTAEVSDAQLTPTAAIVIIDLPETESQIESWQIVEEKGLLMDEVTEQQQASFEEETGLALWKAYEVETESLGQTGNLVMAFSRALTSEAGEAIGGAQVFIKEGNGGQWSESLSFKVADLSQLKESDDYQELLARYQAVIDQGSFAGVEAGSQLQDLEFIVASTADGPVLQFQVLSLEKDGQSLTRILLGVPDEENPAVWYGIDTESLGDEGQAAVSLKVLASAESTSAQTEYELSSIVVLPERIAAALLATPVELEPVQPALTADLKQIIDLRTGEELAWQDEAGQWWLAGESAPTPTPEVTAEPVTPLPELIQNLSETEKQEILNFMIEQFPLEKENNAYHMFCVGGEILSHDPVIKLPTGQEIAATIYCQYYDVDGKQQGFHLPLFSYSYDDLTAKHTGYWPNTFDSSDEAQRVLGSLLSSYRKDPLPPGVPGVYERSGWSGPGHIFYLNFAIPNENNDFSQWSENGYFNEAIQALITQEQLDNFNKTGDPAYLPQTSKGEAIMLPVDISFKNIFGSSQSE